LNKKEDNIEANYKSTNAHVIVQALTIVLLVITLLTMAAFFL